jgi:iron complex outermembrane receptor protein
MRPSIFFGGLMRRRTSLSAICFVTSCIARQVVAATPDAPVEEIVVTGTLDKATTDLTSMAPVDVISADRLAATGFSDLSRALETTEPELNFNRPTAQPTVSTTRPITLNGLYPDELLVLINGKRAHSSAVLNTNVGLGRGSAPFDLSTIPLSAVDHIEVLRDGASAQYGSDAIAGVINIILKSNASGGVATVQGGITERGDGANGLGSVNDGLRIGDRGFLSLTAEGNIQGSTDRAGIDQRYDRKTWYLGDPAASGFNLAANGGYPGLAIGDLYGNVLVSRKSGMDRPVFEVPGFSPLYPAGFLPHDTLILWDVNGTAGVRGDLGEGFNYDLSNTYGRSSADFYSDDSANPTLGSASPTHFYAGTPIYDQDVTDLTFTRPLPEILAGGNFAAGGQFRYEHYEIQPGDPASTAGAGAASLPGFQPRIPVDNGRTAVAGFVDLELQPLKWLTVDGAGRFDHYNDFGSATTWKFSARAQATGWLAFRGEAGTGFRAPSMQQEYYNTVSTTATGANKALVNVGTFQVADPVSRDLGASPLQPEQSHNYSVGMVVTPDPRLSFTAGLFRIDINHRIALIDSQSGSAVTAVLAAAGITNVSQVAFFTNGLDTETKGANLTLSYKGDLGTETSYILSAGYDRNMSILRSLARDPVAPTLTLLGAHSQVLLTDAQPGSKAVADLTLFHGPFSATVDVTRYGEFADIPGTVEQQFSANTIVDLAASLRIFEGGTLTLGILNVGDVFPDKLTNFQSTYATFGGAYLYDVTSPDGTDGRSYYLRLAVRF